MLRRGRYGDGGRQSELERHFRLCHDRRQHQSNLLR
jgi:hypothetical protein